MSRTKRVKEYYPTSYWGGETYHVGDWHIEWYEHWRCLRTWIIIPKDDRKAYGKVLHQRHKESSTANERSPSRMYRNRRESEYRNLTKAEIHRFMKNEEHEVLIPEFPYSHLWDWR